MYFSLSMVCIFWKRMFEILRLMSVFVCVCVCEAIWENLCDCWDQLYQQKWALHTIKRKTTRCMLFGLSKERPILGDNRKAHSEKRCTFHEKQHWKPDPKGRCVLNQLFLMISGAFHMKSTMLFMKSATFHEKHHFSWKAPLFERPLARNCNPMFSVFVSAPMSDPNTVSLDLLYGLLFLPTM